MPASILLRQVNRSFLPFFIKQTTRKLYISNQIRNFSNKLSHSDKLNNYVKAFSQKSLSEENLSFSRIKLKMEMDIALNDLEKTNATNPKHQNYSPETVKEILKVRTTLGQVPNAFRIYSLFKEKAIPLLSEDPKRMKEFETILSVNKFLPFKFSDLNRTKVVKQGEWEILDDVCDTFDALITAPLNPCCALFVQNTRTKYYGLYHSDHGLGLEDILAFFKSISPDTRNELKLKIITYPSTCESTKPANGYPEGIIQAQIREILFQAIQKNIMPIYSNIEFASFKIGKKTISESNTPFFTPLYLKDDEDISEAIQSNLNYFSYIGLLFSYILNKSDDRRYLDHLSQETNQYLMEMLLKNAKYSFGINKDGDVFNTEYVTSLRTYGAPTDFNQLLYLPYQAITHLVVPAKGDTIYQSSINKSSAQSQKRLGLTLSS